MPRWTAACAMIGLLVGGAAYPAAAQSGWNTYGNGRFGYSICYPAALLHPQPESANGDGRMFTGAHHANLAVWGNWNVLTSNVKEARGADLARLREAGYQITYNVMRPGWYVLSGAGHGSIVYLKSLVSAEKQVAFELRYPVTDAARWNPVLARLSHCLAG